MKHPSQEGLEAQLAELFRSNGHIERKVERALREIDGEGRELGLRGQVQVLATKVSNVNGNVEKLEAEVKKLERTMGKRFDDLAKQITDRLRKSLPETLALWLGALALAAMAIKAIFFSG